MRARVGAGLAVLALVVGLVALREATQNRPDPVQQGSATELTLEVRTKGGYSPLLAAQGLWGVCQQTVQTSRLRGPVTALAGGRFSLVLEPALGHNAGKRLAGCLEDATVPRVSADLVARRDISLR